MRAIEINSKTDSKGDLKIDFHLGKVENKVRVLILLDDAEDDERMWIDAITQNPAFDFLKDEEEIYSLRDGKPI